MKTIGDHPVLLAEWDAEKNGGLDPHSIAIGSHNPYWYICPHGHSYAARRYRKEKIRGCPYCDGKRTCIKKSLGVKSPNLAKDWHEIKNGELTPFDVTACSSRKFWWRCPKSPLHDYPMSCNLRARGQGCPYCAGKKVCFENSLAMLPVVAEWSRKNQISPDKVRPNTHKKYWWVCQHGHEWLASPHDRVRVGGGSNCPHCKESKGERSISLYLQSLNVPFKRQVSFKTCKRKRVLPFDFLVKTPTGGLLVEYQGKQHYYPTGFGTSSKDKRYKEFIEVIKRDNVKKIWCEQRRIRLAVIPFWEIERLDEILDIYLSGGCPVYSDPPTTVKRHEDIRRRIATS